MFSCKFAWTKIKFICLHWTKHKHVSEVVRGMAFCNVCIHWFCSTFVYSIGICVRVCVLQIASISHKLTSNDKLIRRSIDRQTDREQVSERKREKWEKSAIEKALCMNSNFKQSLRNENVVCDHEIRPYFIYMLWLDLRLSRGTNQPVIYWKMRSKVIRSRHIFQSNSQLN